MQVIQKNGIVALIPKVNIGFRIDCNIPPEEMKERKEEFIKEILNRVKFDWDIDLRDNCSSVNFHSELHSYIVRLV